jgi:hypothetical protein
MNGGDILGSSKIRRPANVKSSSLVLYRDRDSIRLTAATNIDTFSGIPVISMNDRVSESFAQCDLDIALALRNTAALPEQEHESIHEGRDRSQFARQRALQFDTRADLIMGYGQSETFLQGPSQFGNDHVRSPRSQTLHHSPLNKHMITLID